MSDTPTSRIVDLATFIGKDIKDNVALSLINLVSSSARLIQTQNIMAQMVIDRGT